MRFYHHPAVDEIDNYVLERSDQQEREKFEEHILLCEQCRVELDATNALINALKKESSADLKKQFQLMQGKRRKAGST